MCQAVQWFRRKDKQVRTMHRHTEEVLYLLCFRSEGSSANQCSVSEKKISKSELCIGTAPALPFLLCVSKAKIVFTVCCEAQSSKVWPKLELQSNGHAKSRAGAPFWSKTSSGSAFEVQNLERERIRSVERNRTFNFSIQTASATYYLIP